MDINPTQTAASATAASTQSSATQSASVLSSDFETFLKMLTAQAEYQDPLEPIDSSEYAAQLAQFSMVEQQVATNELLETLITGMGLTQISGLAGWIGMEALSTAPANFTGSPVTLRAADIPTAADEMALVVKDQSGREVQRQIVPVTDEQITWAGVNDRGRPFDAGLYSFSFEFRANDETLSSAPAQTYALVQEARLDGNDTVLILDGGASIRSDAVLGVRQPS